MFSKINPYNCVSFPNKVTQLEEFLSYINNPAKTMYFCLDKLSLIFTHTVFVSQENIFRQINPRVMNAGCLHSLLNT